MRNHLFKSGYFVVVKLWKADNTVMYKMCWKGIKKLCRGSIFAGFLQDREISVQTKTGEITEGLSINRIEDRRRKERKRC